MAEIVAEPMEWSPPTVSRKSVYFDYTILLILVDSVFSKLGKTLPFRIGYGWLYDKGYEGGMLDKLMFP